MGDVPEPQSFTFAFRITGKVSIIADSKEEAIKLSQEAVESLEGDLADHPDRVDSNFIEVKLYEY